MGFFTFSVGYPPSQNDVEVAEDCFQVSVRIFKLIVQLFFEEINWTIFASNSENKQSKSNNKLQFNEISSTTVTWGFTVLSVLNWVVNI